MILYLDTSALLKLFVTELHSERVREWRARAAGVATSRVALPEAVSAIARRLRAGDLGEADAAAVREALLDQWTAFAAVDIDEHRAADLALKHVLRGFDSIHLAAALALRDSNPPLPVAFSSFDGRLNDAARSEGLEVLQP